MSSVVLDASALIALIREEPGSERVSEALTSGGIISSVNLSEAVAKLIESADGEAAVREAIASVKLDVVDFDTALAWATGLLRNSTSYLGLSFGDRACVALGASLGLPVLTADSAWSRLDVGVEVRLIR